MTKIDFYILSDQTTSSREVAACKIIEKAYMKQKSIFVFTDSKQQSQQYDALLWTFRAGSFLPHDLYTEDATPPSAPILISHERTPTDHNDVLINATQSIPECFSQFDRVIEIIDPQARQQGRERYSHYRDRGYHLDTHNVTL